MRIATLELNDFWFEEIASGRKNIDYRMITGAAIAALFGGDPATHAEFYSGEKRVVRKIEKIDIGPCPYPGWFGLTYQIYLGEVKP